MLSQTDLLNAIKKQHMSQLTNINECQLIDDNEIQFQIESKLADSVANVHRTTLNRLGSSVSPGDVGGGGGSLFNQTPYYYHIEILAPSTSLASSRNSLNNKLFKPKFGTLLSQQRRPVWLKFKFKIEDSISQVIIATHQVVVISTGFFIFL